MISMGEYVKQKCKKQLSRMSLDIIYDYLCEMSPNNTTVTENGKVYLFSRFDRKEVEGGEPDTTRACLDYLRYSGMKGK